MKRFNHCFKRTAQLNRPAYIPFLMLGDPNPTESLRIIEAVIASGIDALELGIPFSDPIADGPIVTQAALRSCQHQLSVDDYFAMIATLRSQHPTLPIGILVYANLVYRYGVDPFYQQAYISGVDAVLIPDLPTLEAMPYLDCARLQGIDPILLATPTCQQADLELVARYTKGFTYLVTRPGVTGVDKACHFAKAKTMVEQLNRLDTPPCVFGFGIKSAKDVAKAYDAGAKGVIIGSALIDGIHQMNLEQCTSSQITAFARSLFVA